MSLELDKYLLKYDSRNLFQEDCNNNIEWFKTAKDTHGSITVKAYREAKRANRHGKYTIGNTDRDVEKFLKENATLSNIFKLEIPHENQESRVPDDTESQERLTLSLEDIRDVQVGLMLLGRDTTEEIQNEIDIEKNIEKDYFMQVCRSFYIFHIAPGQIVRITHKRMRMGIILNWENFSRFIVLGN